MAQIEIITRRVQSAEGTDEDHCYSLDVSRSGGGQIMVSYEADTEGVAFPVAAISDLIAALSLFQNELSDAPNQ